MDSERSGNWGLLAIIGAGIFAGLTYGVISAGPPPSLRFAVAEGLLLLSVAVMIADLVVKTVRSH